eukprot:CAMPEP_0172916204 /NCGR_PEP_ID=MMETSP1075-20121228/195881_1 /TAXON_ID=2916 /ORGANISM="Ceratium fusus, Strain PA161109" /LENGTH=35 /DNA_ID= /DNA_START= /DNA_END= /DNA_ORIENTATION=
MLRMEGLQPAEAASPLVPPELTLILFMLAALSTAA